MLLQASVADHRTGHVVVATRAGDIVTRVLDFFGFGGRNRRARAAQAEAIQNGVADIVQLSKKVEQRAKQRNTALDLQKKMTRTRAARGRN